MNRQGAEKVIAAIGLGLSLAACTGGSDDAIDSGGGTSSTGKGGQVSSAGGSSGSTSGGSTSVGGSAGTSSAGSLGTSGSTSSGGSNASGGSSGTGGGSSSATASPGCGTTPPTTGYIDNGMVTVDGVTYNYGLSVAATYDQNTPLPLVFWWHGSGGGGQGDHEAMKWDLEMQMPAIYFYPTNPDGNWDLDGDSIDVHLFDSMYDSLTNGYCVDTSRVYSMGFSQGGHFTNVLSCARGDKIRGASPESGGHGSASGCKGPVAWAGVHGTNDGTVLVAEGRAARDAWLTINGCQSTSTPYDPQPMPHTDAFAGDLQPTCVKYDCPAEYPVHWCEYPGGHDYQVWPHYLAATFWMALP